LILLHGLLGDTGSMAKGLFDATDGPGSVMDRFDLVLAYDYENIATRIEETAQLFANELGKVGIGKADDKHVTILAHGLGGLVARWYIEQAGGAEAVDHLIMCGAPNGGSPLGQVGLARKILGGLASLAFNMLGPIGMISSVPAVLLVMEKSKKFTVTLEQLAEQSPLLTTLDSSPAPGVRYSVIGGDVSQFTGGDSASSKRLIEKVGKSAAAAAVLGSRHDVTASIASSTAVNRSWQPAPMIYEIGCHHLNYFTSTEGVGKIHEVLVAGLESDGS
jgi:pimeloyl-ACP methyl ester carboxylesterase